MWIYQSPVQVYYVLYIDLTVSEYFLSRVMCDNAHGYFRDESQKIIR